MIRLILHPLIFILTLFNLVVAQSNHHTKGQLYLSWGYNKEWYANSNLTFTQPTLGNELEFRNVKGNDKPGWNTGLFNKPLTIPQYNYRFGYFLNDKYLVELNFDHTKFIIPNQELHLIGKLNNRVVDTFFQRTNSNLAYQLNNGANFFLFNFGIQYSLGSIAQSSFQQSILFKAGIGFTYPHVQNTILGFDNKAGFQFGGFDTGLESSYKLSCYKWVYLEYAIKTVYARYRNLNIYEGKLDQNIFCFEMILNLGFSINILKKKALLN